jgi:hypothetical protein
MVGAVYEGDEGTPQTCVPLLTSISFSKEVEVTLVILVILVGGVKVHFRTFLAFLAPSSLIEQPPFLNVPTDRFSLSVTRIIPGITEVNSIKNDHPSECMRDHIRIRVKLTLDYRVTGRCATK